MLYYDVHKSMQMMMINNQLDHFMTFFVSSGTSLSFDDVLV